MYLLVFGRIFKESSESTTLQYFLYVYNVLEGKLLFKKKVNKKSLRKYFKIVKE